MSIKTLEETIEEAVQEIYTMDVRNRYLYFLNEINEEGYDESQIDFDFIISVLRKKTDNKLDFNIIPEKFDSLDDFRDFQTVIENAYNSKSPFIQRNCRDCGEKFFIYKSELEFYESRGLSLPKRCKSCRIKNKSIAV